MIPVVVCLALLAAAPDPQAELTKGIVAFGRGDLETARKHLDEAESLTTDAPLLARIHRQRGIIDQVEGKRLSAVISFMRALYFDREVDLDEREHRGEVQRLFSCAKALNLGGLSEKAVEIRYAKDFERADWTCPAGAKPPPPAASTPPPPPPLAPPSTEEREESSVASSPWLWIGIAAGVVVIAGATTAGVLLSGGEDPYGGSTGVNIRLER